MNRQDERRIIRKKSRYIRNLIDKGRRGDACDVAARMTGMKEECPSSLTVAYLLRVEDILRQGADAAPVRKLIVAYLALSDEQQGTLWAVLLRSDPALQARAWDVLRRNIPMDKLIERSALSRPKMSLFEKIIQKITAPFRV